MGIRYDKAAFSRRALLLLAIAGLFPGHAAGESHPQEVLDLVAAYDALAMKVRPLQDRVKAAGFRPEGAPVRAKSEAETRAPERLRHKNRAVSDEEAGQLLGRLGALEKRILAERERVNRPEFGAGLREGKAAQESGGVQFGDGIRGRRPPAEQARQTLASLQQELADLAREVDALDEPPAR